MAGYHSDQDLETVPVEEVAYWNMIQNEAFLPLLVDKGIPIKNEFLNAVHAVHEEFTETPRVGGSTPSLGTFQKGGLQRSCKPPFCWLIFYPGMNTVTVTPLRDEVLKVILPPWALAMRWAK